MPKAAKPTAITNHLEIIAEIAENCLSPAAAHTLHKLNYSTLAGASREKMFSIIITFSPSGFPLFQAFNPGGAGLFHRTWAPLSSFAVSWTENALV